MPHTPTDLGLAALEREIRAGLGNRLNPEELAALRAAAVAEINRQRGPGRKSDVCQKLFTAR